MTDYIDHYAEAELMLAEAHAWAKVAGEPTPESNELAYITYAAVHALLAIHDTLTAADRYAANEARQREAAREATGGDLSASQTEADHGEGGDDDDAQKAILCPECGHHIHTHDMDGCLHILCCPRTPEDVARALIADAVNTERDRLTDQLRATTNSVIAELDELAAWETHTDG